MFTACQRDRMIDILNTHVNRINIYDLGDPLCVPSITGVISPICNSGGLKINVTNMRYYKLKLFSITGALVKNTSKIYLAGCGGHSGILFIDNLSSIASGNYDYELTVGGNCGEDAEAFLTGIVTIFSCKTGSDTSNIQSKTTSNLIVSKSIPIPIDCGCRPFVTTDLINQSFNFGYSSLEYLGSDLLVGNNGFLHVNDNSLTRFPLEYTFLAGDNTPPVSGSSSDLSICNNSTLTIDNVGQFIVGDAAGITTAEVKVLSGSTLILKNGSNMKINNNSKLIIECGGRLIFEQGASIELNGNNAQIEIKGHLEIGDNATFTFTGNGSLIKYGSPDMLIPFPNHTNNAFVVSSGTSVRLWRKLRSRSNQGFMLR